MVPIKDWSLLLEAAALALWPKPQQMCCFCFSLANLQPSASSLRTAREQKNSTPPHNSPATNNVNDEAFLLHVSGERKKRVTSVGANLAMTSHKSVCALTSKKNNKKNNNTHVLTQANCCLPQAAISTMCGSQFELLGNRSTCLSRKKPLEPSQKSPFAFADVRFTFREIINVRRILNEGPHMLASKIGGGGL